jgi:hypothetical protein
MHIDVVLLVVIGLTLFGLIRSTESILGIRQRRRNQSVDPKIYL